MHYLKLASDQNYLYAQLNLGFFYYEGFYLDKNINKGIQLLRLSSINGCKEAFFILGYLYHEGKNVRYDINKAIEFYKEASSFNIHYSKNNLGVIYRYGIEIEKQNVAMAIIYFDEAIRQKNDFLSMYNKANILLYDETVKNVDDAINLLIESSNEFIHSLILLCIALIKKHGFNETILEKDISTHKNISSNLAQKILKTIKKLNIIQLFEYLYNLYNNELFLYNESQSCIPFSQFQNKKLVKQNNVIAHNITSEFYEGFGNDL